MNDADVLLLESYGKSLEVILNCLAHMTWGQHELMKKVSDERARLNEAIQKWKEAK